MEEENRESKQFLSFLLLGIGATTGLRGFPQASGEGSETFTAARYTHTRTHGRRVWPPVVVTTPRFRPFDSAGASLIGNLGPEANGRRAPIRFLFLSSHVKYVAY